jgi:hypothetical protein
MTTTTTAVEYATQEFQGLEEVLSVLDNHAAPRGTNIGRKCLEMYQRLVVLRESELAEWNATEDVKIHRCTEASLPYHTDVDGVCEVYTSNTTKLCDLCEQAAIDAADKAKAEFNEYRMAKRRGEDV